MFENEKQMIAHGTLELSRWFGNFVENLEQTIANLQKQNANLIAENARLINKYEPKAEKVAEVVSSEQ